MKALVLAGGFAKRLWPLTKDKPKPLLEVGGRPIMNYAMDKLASTRYRNAELLVEESTREEKKPGAIAAVARCQQE